MAGFLNSDAVWRDQSAKSLSFFCTEDVIQVDDSLVEELLAISAANGSVNARICLHASPEADFHEMIILERAGHYCRPHKHVGKGESCHVIRGRLAVFVFADDGGIERCMVLDETKHVMSRVGRNRWHAVLPLSEAVVYHEAKPGPFLGAGDSLSAEWAPAEDDDKSIARFLETLAQRAEHDGASG